MATPSIAANAYSALAKMTDPGSALGKTTGEGTGQSFSTMLKDAVGAVTQTGKVSDTQSQSLATGKANIVDVATAVADTESAIETLVAVRDKVIQAYQQIMQMPI